MIVTRRDEVVEEYHGTPVADPYRWLEDAAAPDVQAWVAEQNAATAEYIAATGMQPAIVRRLTELWDSPKFGPPERHGGWYFYTHNAGLQNQAVIYRQATLDGPPTVVLDPNTLSADGTVAVNSAHYTDDGTLLAYGASGGGSDWQEIRVRRVADAADRPDVLRWCKFSGIAWRRDNAGFFYNRFPDPATVAPDETTYHARVCWHALGTDQDEDVVVLARPDFKELSFDPATTDDGEYVIVNVWNGTEPRNRIYYRPMADDGEFVRLLDDADAEYVFLGNDGPVWYFRTTLDAPLGRIIAIDTRQPERAHWREIVPQGTDALEFALLAGGEFVAVYLHDARHVVRRFGKDGADQGAIPLPGIGAIVGISGKPNDRELFLSYTSYLVPASVYRFDFTTGNLTALHGAAARFDADAYETEQTFSTSKDGTRIPLFLTRRKGLAKNGNLPVLLYGYGGFNISLTPAFAPSVAYWLERGGVYAVANLRGGGEYGEAWHAAGTLARKQNVFDDFVAAAEWLIADGYTNSSRLAIEGGSNGGLLVAACEVQRPDLFGAVLCRVPVIDMLRYHRFTVGRYWVSDYGDAEHDAEQFRFLYAYSPLHNVRAGVAYPPTLILSADTDDRVVPAHAKKFAATLQWANAGPQPLLLRVETRAGHGLGKPTTKVIEEQADKFAFLLHLFGMGAE